MKQKIALLLFFIPTFLFTSQIEVGLDRVFSTPYVEKLQGKRIGIITNQTSVDKNQRHVLDLFGDNQEKYGFKLTTIFAPEHGLEGKLKAFEQVDDTEHQGLRVYSLHGKTKRPTSEMLSEVDLLVYDIQTVGTRCYTYETTLFYCMEEAVKYGVSVLVLDRPNLITSKIEGQRTNNQRCFFSYVDIPFCHGMTIGELASYFNQEYDVNCNLDVVPMKGFERNQEVKINQLNWVPPSPNMKDIDTPLYYPATITLGETLEIVSIDLGGDKPFKRLGAPWINGEKLATSLNQKGLKGIEFTAHSFIPKGGRYQNEECHGIILKITHPKQFEALKTQYTLLEEIRSMYPKEFSQGLERAENMKRRAALSYLTGSKELFDRLKNNQEITSYMVESDQSQIAEFLPIREKYLLY